MFEKYKLSLGNSRLDEIDNLDIAVKELINKGTPTIEVLELLRKRGVKQQELDSIFAFINQKYTGVKRLESGRTIRFLNFLIDTAFLMAIYVFVDIYIDSNIGAATIILIPFCYYVIFETIWGQTLGKLLTRSIVVDKDGKIPNLLTIIFRTICRLITLNPIKSFLKTDFLHDSWPNTVVVDKNRWLNTYI